MRAPSSPAYPALRLMPILLATRLPRLIRLPSVMAAVLSMKGSARGRSGSALSVANSGRVLSPHRQPEELQARRALQRPQDARRIGWDRMGWGRMESDGMGRLPSSQSRPFRLGSRWSDDASRASSDHAPAARSGRTAMSRAG
jgi:hypothetical protein